MKCVYESTKEFLELTLRGKNKNDQIPQKKAGLSTFIILSLSRH